MNLKENDISLQIATVATLSKVTMKRTREKRTRSSEEEEAKEEIIQVQQRDDEISEISKESTYLPRKKKQKTRNNVSVTIECITKLDRDSVKKLISHSMAGTIRDFTTERDATSKLQL